ncbi:hypothetical protein [Caloramator sp. Dgby_cultured_2]|uniref:hypothetical protein n=1 Tax=Caloramator sp. Dgby_cultured_2 TaxID=3029174 RepID=UPI00237EC648|nr:hypothetical protein [Caloramator sp. Dgby_cultured_2]WDU83020.1 hypothetical protein PWK10_16635 [Caloramator sp. Dgby_cultured_2]
MEYNPIYNLYILIISFTIYFTGKKAINDILKDKQELKLLIKEAIKEGMKEIY